MKYLAAIVTLVLCVSIAPGAMAQATGASGTYADGWNMAAGPAGTNFSAAAYLFAWQNGAYVALTGKIASACQGYWAYFLAPSSIGLAASREDATQTCSLQSGWNLVGNPFTADAIVPAGVVAYHWNPQRASYDMVSTLHPGEAVWIYSAAPGAVTLTRNPAPTVVPAPTLTISALAGPGPYQVHVGDTVRVTVPYVIPATTTANPSYLALQESGYQVELSCIGDPLCQMNPTVQFWTFRAVGAGVTTIAVAPACTAPACGAPIQTIQVTVLP